MGHAEFQPLTGFSTWPDNVMQQRADKFLKLCKTRRTVREFATTPVPDAVVESCLKAAHTAPSGANRQPWSFVWVKTPDVRQQIRTAAEAVEEEFYDDLASDEWLEALTPLGTNHEKPFLENAAVLIAVFAEAWKVHDGKKVRNYYVSESAGIATGFLIAALHHAGLATLTHTPSPMRFLGRILGRPENERAYVLVVAGHPATGCKVPVISRRAYSDVVFTA